MPPPQKKLKTTHPTADQDQNRGGFKAPAIPLPRLSTLRAAFERERKRVKLSTLPLDVLGEISNHLHPRDLLNLTLTCKRVAQFLLNPHQEYIWRNARLRTPGMPELPSFMNERAFARLLYSRRCNHCGEDNALNVRWTWFARYCSECLPKA
ncbi:hypothetical protein L227DRAFT_330640 [Lentinus tigrinus ALCF2SS1-6]|uniref:F-box domain-containing protein n=2 Tax=Lentinus tigrinus TaxID=5365 RepID=A0A5C2SLG9_9APHY|nr:hypothetical protein L227DRAFT_330640 [Lentinus tigrinus ALCF2SS1-6]